VLSFGAAADPAKLMDVAGYFSSEYGGWHCRLPVGACKSGY
jgi:hypothetical protein